MSYTELYKFTKSGNAKQFAEIQNAFRGAMAVWMAVEKKYLPSLPRPSWATRPGDVKDYYSRTSSALMGGDYMKEIWELIHREDINETDLLALVTTFDNVVIMRENIPEVIKAFNEFEGDTSLKEQAEAIQKLLDTDKTFIAIAWNQTSVNGDAWTNGSKPYNILKQINHWNPFKAEEVS